MREDNSPGGFDAVGLAVQFQQAIGRRTIFIIDGFFAANDETNNGHGIRTEILVKF